MKIENDSAAVSPTDASVVFNGGFGANKKSLFADGVPLAFGNDSDLEISHDDTDASIVNSKGSLRLQNDTFIVLEKVNGDNMLRCDGGGAVNLFFNNRLKLATNDGGITVTGGITASGITTTSGLLDINAGGQANTFKVEDLTAGRVVLAGTGGELEDSSSLTFSGSTLSGTFSGALTGNVTGTASNATVAQTVATSEATSTAHFLTFVPTTGTANNTVKTNSDYYVLPNDTDTSALFVRGDITAFAAAASDDKLKTNKVVINDALDKVLSLSGFTFEWNELGARIIGIAEGTKSVGISAQKVQEVVPEAVKSVTTPEGDDFLSVKYEKLVPLLIEAIKELNGKVEDLQQQLLDK